jgi:hypothetical protein
MSAKPCEHVDREPIYIKRLGNFVIDPSEYENEKGAFFRYEETPCKFIADEGHKYCPRHEVLHLAETEGTIQ